MAVIEPRNVRATKWYNNLDYSANNSNNYSFISGSIVYCKLSLEKVPKQLSLIVCIRKELANKIGKKLFCEWLKNRKFLNVLWKKSFFPAPLLPAFMDPGWWRFERVFSIRKTNVSGSNLPSQWKPTVTNNCVFNRKDVLPKSADWIKQSVASFDPDNNKVTTDNGDVISYEFLVVAMGLQLNYNQVNQQIWFALQIPTKEILVSWEDFPWLKIAHLGFMKKIVF